MTNYITSVGIQQFSITIASGSTTGTAAINAVGSGAFILFGGLNPSGTTNAAESFAYLTLTNSTTITATRNTGTAGTIVVTGSIIDGDTTNLIKSIQYGTVAIAATATSGTQGITGVTNNNTAIHLLGWSTTNTTISGINEYPALSLSGTTVTAARAGGTTGTLTVGFCIIEFQGSALNQNVQNINATSSSSVTSYTVSGLNAVVEANAICIYGGSNIATVTTDYAEIKQYGALASTTSFTVHVNTAIADAKTYNCTLVEFAAGVLNSAVQRGTTTLTGVTSNTSTLSSINESYAGLTWLANTSNTTATDVNRSEGAASLGNQSDAGSSNFLSSGTITTPFTATGFSSTASGSLLAITIAYYSSSTVTVTSVTDNKGQTWVQFPGARATDSSAGQFTDVWYFPNTASGVTSVTATLSVSTGSINIDFFELTGMPTSSVTDVAGTPKNNASTSTSAVTNGITTLAPGDFIIAVAANAASGPANSANAPFTFNGGTSTFYTPSTTVSAQTATLKYSTTDTYCASIVAFFSNGVTPVVTVTKNSATGNITGSWEVFEFPAYIAPSTGFNAGMLRRSLSFSGSPN